MSTIEEIATRICIAEIIRGNWPQWDSMEEMMDEMATGCVKMAKVLMSKVKELEGSNETN